MARDFELIDHTADIGVIAYGADIAQAFANAGRALFSLITETDTLSERTFRDIEVEASDEAGLLVAWLNELIFIFDTEHLLFKRFEVTLPAGERLRARGYGEPVDKTRHSLKTGVKAATYHLLSVERDKDACKVRVIFDV